LVNARVFILKNVIHYIDVG